MIKLQNITKKYISDSQTKLALNDISFEFNNNCFISILGKSGSGKTTLMNIIGGLDSPTSGSVIIDEKDIAKMNSDELARFRNENIGYIFQSFYLENSFTVFDNISFPLLINNTDKNVINEKVREVIQKFGLENLTDKKVSTLSGGEKQRVCIARALINDPKIVLADEPTGSLDSENGKIVLNYLKRISKENKIVILVTHNRDDAYEYSDTIINLADGKIIGHETL